MTQNPYYSVYLTLYLGNLLLADTFVWILKKYMYFCYT